MNNTVWFILWSESILSIIIFIVVPLHFLIKKIKLFYAPQTFYSNKITIIYFIGYFVAILVAYIVWSQEKWPDSAAWWIVILYLIWGTIGWWILYFIASLYDDNNKKIITYEDSRWSHIENSTTQNEFYYNHIRSTVSKNIIGLWFWAICVIVFFLNSNQLEGGLYPTLVLWGLVILGIIGNVLKYNRRKSYLDMESQWYWQDSILKKVQSDNFIQNHPKVILVIICLLYLGIVPLTYSWAQENSVADEDSLYNYLIYLIICTWPLIVWFFISIYWICQNWYDWRIKNLSNLWQYWINK